MSLAATARTPRSENFGGGLTTSVFLHLAVAGSIAAAVILGHYINPNWGENASTTGSIEVSAVDALPLPHKVDAVEKQVLVNPDVSKVPAPQVKAAAEPPPRPDSIAIKAPTPTKTAPTPHVATPAPQPVPTTPKATSGSSATQIPAAIQQVTHGTASLTVQNHTFGVRYAYYLDAMQRIIGQNWNTGEADARTSTGKSVTLTFDVNSDGQPTNIRIKTSSGSPSLDASAMHALQRTDGFGPLPAGAPNSVNIEDTFNYHQ